MTHVSATWTGGAFKPDEAVALPTKRGSADGRAISGQAGDRADGRAVQPETVAARHC